MDAEKTAELVLVYSPCPDLATAERLGRRLVEARLAGCVNILPRMVSIYPWEGRLERAEEAVLIVKTTAGVAEAVRARLESEHPYEVPAILVLPVAAINAPYAEWLAGNVGRDTAFPAA